MEIRSDNVWDELRAPVARYLYLVRPPSGLGGDDERDILSNLVGTIASHLGMYELSDEELAEMGWDGWKER